MVACLLLKSYPPAILPFSSTSLISFPLISSSSILSLPLSKPILLYIPSLTYPDLAPNLNPPFFRYQLARIKFSITFTLTHPPYFLVSFTLTHPPFFTLTFYLLLPLISFAGLFLLPSLLPSVFLSWLSTYEGLQTE